MSNRNLWWVGLSFFGVYGAGLTTVQLLPTYLSQVSSLSAQTGGFFSALFVLMAIPGSVVGGLLADRATNLRAVFVWPWVLLGLSLCLFPFLGLFGVWMMVLVAGTCQQFGFSAWAAMPGHYRDRVFPEDVATAEGLLLTAGGLGGFVLPILFGLIVRSSGYPPAFLFGGIASILFAVLGFAAQEPQRITTATSLSEAYENAEAVELGERGSGNEPVGR